MANASSHRDIVAIGASAGGLPQIRMLLELLPPDLPAIALVVLHRPGDQVSYLREVLACKSRMPVVEAIHGQELLVATCYLGQPSQHFTRSSSTATPRKRTCKTIFTRTVPSPPTR